MEKGLNHTSTHSTDDTSRHNNKQQNEEEIAEPQTAPVQPQQHEEATEPQAALVPPQQQEEAAQSLVVPQRTYRHWLREPTFEELAVVSCDVM